MRAFLLSTIVLASGLAVAESKPNPGLKSIPLVGAPADGVGLDYIAYDRAHHRVWVPAGNTGKVDVIDTTNGQVATVDGFPTQEMERKGKKRTVGPSSASVGADVVYVGNRGDSTVCAVDAITLKKGACARLESMPDGVQYVASAKEVWVTTPRDKSIVVLDVAKAGALTVKTKMSFEGEPEGYAVDEGRGFFYTNLEDKDKTLTIDIKKHQVTRTWASGCGEDGPKGLAVDHKLDLVVVACSDRVKVLDAGHDGKELSSIATGEGVDNIDYLESRRLVVAAAGRAAKLTIAILDDKGQLKVESVVATAAGARNGVVTEDGVVYLTDAAEGKILVVPAGKK